MTKVTVIIYDTTTLALFMFRLNNTPYYLPTPWMMIILVIILVLAEFCLAKFRLARFCLDIFRSIFVRYYSRSSIY